MKFVELVDHESGSTIFVFTSHVQYVLYLDEESCEVGLHDGCLVIRGMATDVMSAMTNGFEGSVP